MRGSRLFCRLCAARVSLMAVWLFTFRGGGLLGECISRKPKISNSFVARKRSLFFTRIRRVDESMLVFLPWEDYVV